MDVYPSIVASRDTAPPYQQAPVADAVSGACQYWCQPGFGVGFNNGVMEDPGVVSPGGATAGVVARALGVAMRDPVPDVFAPGDGEIEPPAGCLLTYARQAASVLNFRAL